MADREGDGFITGRELADYLRPVVTNITEGMQTPQEGRFFGEGEFIFSLTAGTANLMVNSDPPGARVFLNGELKGTTREESIMLRELKPGSYKLVIRKEGHYDYEEVVVLERGKEKPIAVKLMPRPAVILVNAWPQGAKVYVDGNLKGAFTRKRESKKNSTGAGCICPVKEMGASWPSPPWSPSYAAGRPP